MNEGEDSVYSHSGGLLAARIAAYNRWHLIADVGAVLKVSCGTASSRGDDLKATSNIGRSLHVFVSAARGLSFYALLLVLPGLAVGFALSAHAAAATQSESAAWTLTGSLHTARLDHSATRLQDGKVLVVGGSAEGQEVLDSAELYDPAGGTWSITGHLSVPRTQHSATLLPNGKVLVVGGSGQRSAEVYDPATATWTPTPSLLEEHGPGHTATLLLNGTVLVVGPGSSAEVYDPATGNWTLAGSLHQARGAYTATLLRNGKVLVAGGFAQDGSGDLDSAELYDPVAGIWSVTGSLNRRRSSHTAVILQDGRVLIVDGATSGRCPCGAPSELYDPASGKWSFTGSSENQFSYVDHPSTLLASGEVLVEGGSNGIDDSVADAALFDPHSGLWRKTAALNTARGGHTATLLTNGQVLVAGGANFGRISSAELFTPPTGIIASPPTAIDASFTGSWYDPAQSGHGLMLEVLSDNRLLALWFAFNPDGTQQSWFGGVGTYSGDTATITDVALPTGGSWIPNFDPNKIVREPWGTLTFTFTDHDHGKVSFNSVLGYGSGSMDLLRLTNIAKQTALRPIGSPGAVTTDRSGNVYFSSSPNLIFQLDHQGILKRIAGAGMAGYSGDGGPATQAQLNFPLSYPELVQDPIDYSPLVGGLAVDAAGNLYIADAYNNRVRKIDTNGIINTVVGTGMSGYTGDGGLATNAQITWPQGVAVDAANNLYFTTAYASLRKVTPAGIISSLAGDNCGSSYLGPGLCVPEQIAVDAASNIFVPDGYCRVREVRHDGNIFTVAGADNVPSNGSAFTCGYSGDGGPATKAALNFPYSVVVDGVGNLYIADTFNNCIRKVNSAGIISTIAGICTPNAPSSYSGDGGPATNARLYNPYGLALDGAGNLFIADTRNNRIRKVSADGTITTVAGNGADPAQTGGSVWVRTASLNVARWAHTATLLQNGKVLVAGGNGGLSSTELLDSAELYDPTTGTWSMTAHMGSARSNHTATLLPNGKVLVAGGNGDSGPVSTAELYDPASGAWSVTGNLNVARSSHTAVLLQNGKVLVAAGFGADILGSAELYDPTSGTWNLTGGMLLGRYGNTMTLLQDGRVLITGGVVDDFEGTETNGTELYDPAMGTWSLAGNLPQPVTDHTATLLRNGKVLIAGGSFKTYPGGKAKETSLDMAELFDPADNTLSSIAGLNGSRGGHSATLLPSGDVLVAGGLRWAGVYPQLTASDLDSAELYDADRAAWVSTSNLNIAREGHTATLLPNGQVLVAGGVIVGSTFSNTPLSSAEIYAPPVTIDASFTGSWFDPAQSGHGLMLEVLSDNRLLALWFAFNPDGNQQSWFGGVGTYSGNTATIADVALPTGGSWIPNFDPAKVVRNPWGTLTFTFSDCDHGRVDFSSTNGYGTGSMNLLRLTQPAGLNCP